MPPESEPAAAGQKGKEGASKDKKASAETEKQKSSKQEANEPAPRVEAPGEANSLRDGDKSQKRLEKRRPPLGGFFKGLVGGRCASSFWAFPKGTGWPGGGWALAKHRGPAVCQVQRARWAQALLFRGHRQV